jgi:uncharacterized protein
MQNEKPTAVRNGYAAMIVGGALLAACAPSHGAAEYAESEANQEKPVMQSTQSAAPRLTQAWDKTFPKSEKVDHRKVTFRNRYGIYVGADMYLPKNSPGERLPALAISGPFGAVKEQASGLEVFAVDVW